MGLFPKHRDLTRAVEEIELRVDASALRQRVEDVLVRLDRFLAQRLAWRSRTSIQELIHGGWVSVDAASPERPGGSGEALVERRPGRRLRHGTRIVVAIPPAHRVPAPRLAGDVVVLYEDAEVVALEKPASLPVHPSGRHLGDSLIQRVHGRYAREIAAGELLPRLCHRLDRETSGIVLVGKRRATHAFVMRQFEARTVTKEYFAIVRGEPEEEAGRIELPLALSRVSEIALKMAVVADGAPARTDWQVVRRGADRALLRVRLHTGRQHQIRVHLAAIGHPVIGDKLYGPDEALFRRAIEGRLDERDRRSLELDRHALHHCRLGFTTPDGARRVEVESPLPPDLAAYLAERA